MRYRLLCLALVVVGGCGTPRTTWELLDEEVGRTIAEVTLVAGMPHSIADLPDGRRAFRWERWGLVPRGGLRCVYTLYAVSEGRPQSLAAWRVVTIDPPAVGCGPLEKPVQLLSQ